MFVKMTMAIFLLLLIHSFTQGAGTTHSPQEPVDVCLSAQEQELFDLINSYRIKQGLKTIPFSGKLTLVAKAHVADLTNQYVVDDNNPCNLHSWSDAGDWSACCYTPDHSQARCMWEKPMEIAGYRGDGYEIAFYDSRAAVPAEALEAWQHSPDHDRVLSNKDIWKKVTWNAVGIAVSGEYAVAWFGQVADPSVIRRCGD